MEVGGWESLHVLRDVSAVADSQTASRFGAVRNP
jgi:hypothetical protein